jgi:dTDP-4-amino-4,6-dideoxygalactose transaminase
MCAVTDARLAVQGGTPVRDPRKPWPAWPIFDDRERNALMETLESGNWFYGDRVRRFEEEFAAFQGAEHCITANSGTAALEIVLEALGIGAGDEVIIPPYTFIATASAVMRVGAAPVFVDLDDTWCIDPDLLDSAISDRTKAIMPVHFGGRICDMDQINAIAEKHRLAVVEDACHSWGARWKGMGAGSLGAAGVFSFQMSKNMTAGEGGAILTNDADLAEICRSISNCGRAATGPWYHHVRTGTNARMTEFGAAVLSTQLSRLDDQTATRESNAALLNAGLGEIEGLTPQRTSNRITRRAYHLYCLRINPDAFGCTREKFIAAAKAEGWPIGAGYPIPLYQQPVVRESGLRDYSACCCPAAEDLCFTSGMWFTHELLLGTEEDMHDIIAIAKKIKAAAGTL